MNIDRVNISNSGIERSQGTPPSDSSRSTEKDRQVSAGSDSIALSSRALELSQLSGVLDQSRSERFNAVRASLDAGTYSVSAEDLAGKLIEYNRR
jgi:flagellar biosynthesis anti-sigma factor FlgM